MSGSAMNWLAALRTPTLLRSVQIRLFCGFLTASMALGSFRVSAALLVGKALPNRKRPFTRQRNHTRLRCCSFRQCAIPCSSTPSLVKEAHFSAASMYHCSPPKRSTAKAKEEDESLSQTFRYLHVKVTRSTLLCPFAVSLQKRR